MNKILVVEGEKDKSFGAKKWMGYKYGVLNNDNDPDKDPLIALLEKTTEHGTLDFSDKGTFTFMPEKDYCGMDTFTYKASDGLFESELTLVQINVLCGHEDL